VLEPGLDVKVQQVRPVGEPALAFGREGEQDVLEATKGSLPVDRHQQPLAQRLVGDRRHETLHPAVLFTRRGRIDPQVTAGVVGHLRTPRRRVWFALDDGQQIPVLEIEKALLVRRIAFEGDLEIAPVDVYRRHFESSSFRPSSHGKHRKEWNFPID
jgi:hypothetical protein